MASVFMRRRLPWIIFFGLALFVAAGSQFAAEYDWPPDEDGITVIPLLRKPPPETPRIGPLPMAPLMLADLTWRISFRWLGAAPSASEVEKALREVAAKELPGFAVQPRPARSWLRKFRREPLVPMPGFEFALVVLPLTPDLSPYETASTDIEDLRASGRWKKGEENVHLARELLLLDFHLSGPNILRQLEQLDAFVIAFAERTNARIKSDERLRQATVEDFRGRRLMRWSGDVPFAPSYVKLADENGGGRGRVLATEGATALALPELFVAIPNGVLTYRARNLLIGAVVQRFIENRMPDAPGIIELDVRALRHPDMAEWATIALRPGATGKLRLTATEVPVRGGRAVVLRPDGNAIQTLCQFAGCDLSASFGE